MNVNNENAVINLECDKMRKLSTGMDSTLGNWITLSSLVFGEDSKATKMLKEKAEKATHGHEEEVIADEGQLLYFLMELHVKN